MLAHGLFGGRVILPADSAQYLPVARQNTAFQSQTRAVVQRLHLFQQGVLLHLAQDIGDDHGHLVAGGAGEQTVETDVQLSKAAVIAQGLLRRRETAVQRRQILVGAAPGRPAGDGAVVDGAVLAQLLQRYLVQLEHGRQRLLHAVDGQLLHHGAAGAVGGGHIAALLQHTQGLADGGTGTMELLHHGTLGGQAVAGLQHSGGDKLPQLVIDGLAGPPAADGLPGDMYGFRHGRPSFHRKYPDSIAHPGENSKGRMQESPEDGAFGLSRCGEGDITSSGLSFPRSSWGPP